MTNARYLPRPRSEIQALLACQGLSLHHPAMTIVLLYELHSTCQPLSRYVSQHQIHAPILARYSPHVARHAPTVKHVLAWLTSCGIVAAGKSTVDNPCGTKGLCIWIAACAGPMS